MFTCTCAENLPGGPDSFRIIHRMEHGGMGWHDHEFHEFALVHAGRGGHRREDTKEDELRRGLVVVMPSGARHAYRVEGIMSVTNILIGRTMLARIHRQFGPASVPVAAWAGLVEPHDFATLEHVAAELAVAQQRSAVEGGIGAHGLLLQFIAALRCGMEGRSSRQARARRAVAGALELVEQAWSEELGVAELARASGLGGRTFLRLFKRATGHTPLDYVVRRRIARAAERLLGDDAPVTEIALACGFNDSNYFARQFRRVKGCTPTQFRARSRS